MEVPDILRTAILVITVVGLILGAYAIRKIYSKEGFR